MPSSTDPHLRALRDNDLAGLRELYHAFLPRIRHFITSNGGTAADAEDIFQDALVVLYRKSRQPDFELRSSFYTLLYGVCRNLWGNRLQRKSRTEVELRDDYRYEVIPDVTTDLERAEEERLFWDAFRQLGTDCQELLQLFFAKTKMEEIARRLSLSSVAYAKKKKYQCKEKLIRLIRADPRYAELRWPE
ncbi:MAG: sigma-70 family RNA polymerase sigma factor [Bacteroidota bacterium]